MTPTKIIAVSPRRLVRYGLRFLLGHRQDVRLLAEVDRLAHAARLLTHTAPHVIVVDAEALDPQTLDAAVMQEIRHRHPMCRVVALAELAEVPRLQLSNVGFARVLDRDAVGPELATTLQTVRSARADVLRMNRVAELDSGGEQAARPAVPKLTEREFEVLTLVALGCTNSEIAERLYISNAAAKFHVGSLIRKFGVANRTAVTFEASRIGLIRPTGARAAQNVRATS
ncbi:DNA-binding response regulator, NarL/FixJ family, contains REC and HTH domains [Pseudonocardia thermophila]|jgi:Response regulator containing a CheY-like receiver domain and an HTH DNA-binding domain|uniref:DNA-binding response regulator, NarL/FixJ family, contains REC and HTH domains n=1 Tax=Pseudonocardia thermophila TaxID=1848 RepID=A0A1M6WUS8_PSETH|nr:response regulator transcription factor [Pseudonocardia thermophila]SHK97483.1 DNA-binding response regulator, NarL/FixJ family, contains REC and HTH domains [Pseudonocardia thermophila]